MGHAKCVAYSGALVLFVIFLAYLTTELRKPPTSLSTSFMTHKKRLARVERVLTDLKRQNQDILHRIR
jgi:hypothetical protein